MTRRKTSRTHWSPEEVSTLETLAAKGLSGAMIAKHVPRSPMEVRCKARRSNIALQGQRGSAGRRALQAYEASL